MPRLLQWLWIVTVFSSAARADLVDDYKIGIKAQQSQAKEFSNRMQSGLRADCPTAKSRDMSSCFKEALKAWTIISAAPVPELLNAGMYAALTDKTNGFVTGTWLLMLLDNEISVLEKIDTAKLYVAHAEALTPVNYLELVLLRQEENKNLNKVFENFADEMEHKMATIEARMKDSRQPASVSQWQANALINVKNRLSKIKKSIPHFSTAETRIDGPQVLELTRNERVFEVCSQKPIRQCKGFTQSQCYALTTKAFSDCSTSNRTPASFDGPERVDFYTRRLLKCVSQKWQSAFFQRVRSCS